MDRRQDHSNGKNLKPQQYSVPRFDTIKVCGAGDDSGSIPMQLGAEALLVGDKNTPHPSCRQFSKYSDFHSPAMTGLCSEVLISEVSEGFVVVFYKTGSWAQASLSQDVNPLYF